MNKYGQAFSKGLIKENPVLRLVLGTCPTLAVTTAAINGLGMGAAATFVLVCSNIVISLLRRVIPDKVRLPAYIVIIAGFTTIVQMLVKAYLPDIDKALGIYLPLIVVNCIILGRAEAFASKNSVGLSALDGLGMGAGFTGALIVMGAIREFFGNGTIFGWPEAGIIPPITVFVLPAGGFFVFGMLIWLVGKLSARLEGGKAVTDLTAAGWPSWPRGRRTELMNNTSLFAILIGGLLVNNFVLSQFLGICPFLGVSKKLNSAVGMSLAVIFVMLMATAATWPIYNLLLVPRDLGYLQTIVFILIIAALVQLVEIALKRFLPPLYNSLGIYLPLITTNCAVLGVTILNIDKGYDFGQSLVNALGAGLGFLLAMVMFAGVRERLESAEIPAGLKGLPITLVAASLVSMSFLGFQGLFGL